MHHSIIGKYERDVVKPSIDIAIKVANSLGVSLDYFVGKTSLEVDKNKLKRIEEVKKLSPNPNEQVNLVINALVRDFKAKETYSI